MLFTFTTSIYSVKAQVIQDTITQINKQRIVKKNQSFKAGYIHGAHAQKKGTISAGWCLGTVMNVLTGLLIYQIVTNH